MSPLRGEEFTGRSVEEAIERGLRSLGRKRTDVDIEVLEKGKPANVLGIGGEDARVLLTFQEDESPAEPQPVIDEAEVPRRPDALRERADESEAEEASPVLAEELAAHPRAAPEDERRHAATARSPADVGRTAMTGSRRRGFHSAPRTRAKVVAARSPIRRDPMATATGLPIATVPPRSPFHGRSLRSPLKWTFEVYI